MRWRIVSTAWTLLILAVAAQTGVTPGLLKNLREEKDSAAILQTLEELSKAGMQRDVGALRRIYATNYFHTNADGSVMERDQVLRSYEEPPKAKFESSE